MSKRRAKPRQSDPPRKPKPDLPPPVNVVDGIPDRAEHAPLWKYLAVAGVFLAWLAFLVYCAAAGNL